MGYFIGYIIGESILALLKVVVIITVSVLVCIAHYKYIKFVGKGNPIAAIIPFWGSWTLADTVDADENGNVNVFNGISIPKKVLMWVFTLQILLMFIPVAGKYISYIVGALCKFVIYTQALACIKNSDTESVQIYGIACALLPIFPYFMLVNKK